MASWVIASIALLALVVSCWAATRAQRSVRADLTFTKTVLGTWALSNEGKEPAFDVVATFDRGITVTPETAACLEGIIRGGRWTLARLNPRESAEFWISAQGPNGQRVDVSWRYRRHGRRLGQLHRDLPFRALDRDWSGIEAARPRPGPPRDVAR